LHTPINLHKLPRTRGIPNNTFFHLKLNLKESKTSALPQKNVFKNNAQIKSLNNTKNTSEAYAVEKDKTHPHRETSSKRNKLSQ